LISSLIVLFLLIAVEVPSEAFCLAMNFWRLGRLGGGEKIQKNCGGSIQQSAKWKPSLFLILRECNALPSFRLTGTGKVQEKYP